MNQIKKVVLIIGGPGSGKGTQSSLIEARFGYKHLSAGDLLREQRKSGSADGILIDSIFKAVKIVPSEITVRLIDKAISKQAFHKFVIDGFPRTKENIQVWQKMMNSKCDLQFVINLQCSEEAMINRVLERGKTSGRFDDTGEIIKKRLISNLAQNDFIIHYYEKHGKLRNVSSQTSVEEVFENISVLFDKENGSK